MVLLPDKIYPALSLKCMASNPGMNLLNKRFYIDQKMFTKKLIWPSNSSVYWEVCYLFQQVTEYTNHITFRAKTWVQDFADSLLNDGYKEFFPYEIFTDLSKDIILPAKQEPFLVVTRWTNNYCAL